MAPAAAADVKIIHDKKVTHQMFSLKHKFCLYWNQSGSFLSPGFLLCKSAPCGSTKVDFMQHRSGFCAFLKTINDHWSAQSSFSHAALLYSPGCPSPTDSDVNMKSWGVCSSLTFTVPFILRAVQTEGVKSFWWKLFQKHAQAGCHPTPESYGRAAG